MKIKKLLLAVMLSLPFVLVVRAEEPKQESGKAPKKEHKAETELEGKMDEMGGAFRKLRGQIKDASKNAESIVLVQKMRAIATEAATLKPAKAEDLPEADRAKFIADYQKSMKAFAGTLAKLEAALQAGDNAAAAKLVEEIRSAQKEGHKEFKRPDEKEKK
jgi:soluble cytochrome b562